MSVREVLLYPDRRLKEVARPAQPGELERIGADLVATMRSHPRCVGLAAPQLGEPVRVVVVDCTGHPRVPEPSGLLVLANPRVAEASGAEIAREGCLSIPEVTANVRRPTSVRIEHRDGVVESHGFEARCLLHEIDHLDGILFLDRVASLTDDIFRRKSPG